MQVQPPLNKSPFDSASVGLPFNFNYTISMVFSFVIKHEWIKKSSIEKDQTDVTASHLLREGFSILLFPNRPTPRVGKTVVISVWRLFCPTQIYKNCNCYIWWTHFLLYSNPDKLIFICVILWRQTNFSFDYIHFRVTTTQRRRWCNHLRSIEQMVTFDFF